MAELVYILCSATSIGCAVLLLRGFSRTRAKLLLWSGLCFAGLALNNVLLFVDLVLLPSEIDLALVRSGTALAAIIILLIGLVWEAR